MKLLKKSRTFPNYTVSIVHSKSIDVQSHFFTDVPMSMTGSSMESDGVSKLSGNSSSMTDSLASNSTTTIKGRLKQVQEKCRKSSMTTKLKTKLAGKRKTELSMSASSSATNKQAADSTSSSSASSVRSYSHDALNLLDRGQAILVIHFC